MRIKWIENKSNDFRGNFDQCVFKVDNSDYIFSFTSCMTYKSFKSITRKFSQEFNSKIVEVFEDHGQSNMSIVSGLECGYKFRIELDVPEGATRQFKYYNIDEIFK